MKIFIDTANIDEIRECAAMGIIDGVTTNPSLVAKTKKKFEEVLKEIVEVVDGPISAEVVSLDADGMLAEARKLAAIHRNVVVKYPLTAEGLKAVRRGAKEGIKSNVTLCFSPAQALLAAKAGATYVSPFVGRLDDVAQSGMDLISQIVTIYDNYGFDTQVLVASVRSPMHLVEGALAGAHVATCPYSVIQQLLRHPLTDVGMERFLKDWERVPK